MDTTTSSEAVTEIVDEIVDETEVVVSEIMTPGGIPMIVAHNVGEYPGVEPTTEEDGDYDVEEDDVDEDYVEEDDVEEDDVEEDDDDERPTEEEIAERHQRPTSEQQEREQLEKVMQESMVWWEAATPDDEKKRPKFESLTPLEQLREAILSLDLEQLIDGFESKRFNSGLMRSLEFDPLEYAYTTQANLVFDQLLPHYRSLSKWLPKNERKLITDDAFDASCLVETLLANRDIYQVLTRWKVDTWTESERLRLELYLTPACWTSQHAPLHWLTFAKSVFDLLWKREEFANHCLDKQNDFWVNNSGTYSQHMLEFARMMIDRFDTAPGIIPLINMLIRDPSRIEEGDRERIAHLKTIRSDQAVTMVDGAQVFADRWPDLSRTLLGKISSAVIRRRLLRFNQDQRRQLYALLTPEQLGDPVDLLSTFRLTQEGFKTEFELLLPDTEPLSSYSELVLGEEAETDQPAATVEIVRRLVLAGVTVDRLAFLGSIRCSDAFDTARVEAVADAYLKQWPVCASSRKTLTQFCTGAKLPARLQPQLYRRYFEPVQKFGVELLVMNQGLELIKLDDFPTEESMIFIANGVRTTLPHLLLKRTNYYNGDRTMGTLLTDERISAEMLATPDPKGRTIATKLIECNYRQSFKALIGRISLSDPELIETVMKKLPDQQMQWLGLLKQGGISSVEIDRQIDLALMKVTQGVRITPDVVEGWSRSKVSPKKEPERCFVCFIRPIQAETNCRHQLCFVCATQLHNCPYCRKRQFSFKLIEPEPDSEWARLDHGEEVELAYETAPEMSSEELGL